MKFKLLNDKKMEYFVHTIINLLLTLFLQINLNNSFDS